MKKMYDMLAAQACFRVKILNDKDRYWIGGRKEIGGLELEVLAYSHPVGVCSRLHGETPDAKSDCIFARIRWKGCFDDGDGKFFPLSNEGVIQACEWLDEMRVVYAQQLLDANANV